MHDVWRSRDDADDYWIGPERACDMAVDVHGVHIAIDDEPGFAVLEHGVAGADGGGELIFGDEHCGRRKDVLSVDAVIEGRKLRLATWEEEVGQSRNAVLSKQGAQNHPHRPSPPLYQPTTSTAAWAVF